MKPILIFHAPVLNPPTSLECFRQLTSFIKTFNKSVEEIVIEAKHDEIDFVYKYLKNYPGGLDDIYDFIYEEENISGVRVDNEFRISPTIQAAWITEKNIHVILGAISYN